MNKIEAYLTQAQKRLRRSLPATQVEALISEARTHLTARTMELIEEGASEEQAAATAIAAFGQPEEWASTIIQSAHKDNRTGKARAIAAGAAGLVLLDYLTGFSYRIGLQPLDVYIVAALGLAGGSFQARQAPSKLLLAMGVLTALIGFLICGSTQVYDPTSYMGIPKARINWYISYWTLNNKDAQQEVDLLRLGLQAYQSPVGSKPISSALHTSQGYIVPLPRQEVHPDSHPISWWSAFKESSPPVIASHHCYTDKELLALKAQMPYRTVATVAEAKQAWQNDAPIWLHERQVMLQANRIELRAAQRAAAHPPAFDARDGIYYTIPVGFLMTYILLISGIAAAIGRQVFRLRKRPQAA